MAPKKSTPKRPARKTAPQRRTSPRPAPRKKVEPPAPAERTEAPGQPLAGEVTGSDQTISRLVDITPANRKQPGYRELDVVAVRPGVIGPKHRNQGDVFRVGVLGEGPLPSSVRSAK